ncbi:MAG: DeoR/GlpR transcriptional regulator [Tetrasphaera sp.]|jgi:DeoR family transcriptional regulator of aga operon|nr:DeoR/GlpR transcriptional regulator [Tetrasphaera sp.]
MLAVQRRNETLSLLSRQPVVTVEDLATRMAVSLSTVRRDLDELERQGKVRRVHGGAVLNEPSPTDAPEPPLAAREIECAAEKQAIAARAAALIEPGTVILVSGGTTTAGLAPHLSGIPGITVVTNSLDLAMRLALVDVDVVVLGGALRRPELSLLGSLVGHGLGELHIDHVLMGSYGIDPQSGLLGASAIECETDRRIARSARRLTVLADATKFARRSPHRICTFEAVRDLVTTAAIDAGDLAAVRAQGVDVVVA